MTYKEEIFTVSFGDSIENHPIITREKLADKYNYYLFDKFKIFSKNSEHEEFVRRRKEHKKLSKLKINIENYFSKEYQNKNEKYLLVTISFNNPVIVDYQIQLIRKFLRGNYIHIICDNSNKKESAEAIKKVCISNDITYIRINSDIVPNGYSDSHGVALNWTWENIIKPNQKDFALLDHDIFPIVVQNVDDLFNKQDFWGDIRLFHYDQLLNTKWYLWPGFSFFNYKVVANLKLNFRRYKHFGFIKAYGADTGSGNWNCLFSKYKLFELRTCDVESEKLKEDKTGDFESNIQYFNNRSWLHAINGSEWHQSNGKINLVYQKLDEILNVEIK